MSVPEVSLSTPLLTPQSTQSSVRLSRISCLLCNSMIKPLFHFPKDHKNHLLWLKAIGKEDLLQTMTHKYIYNNGRLCASHFSEKCFTSTLKQKLHKIAVPFCIKNENQASPPESSDGNFENGLSLSESVCRSAEITNFPSSHIGKNSTEVSSSVHDTTSLNKISEKMPFITCTTKPSMEAGVTLLNKDSDKDSVIPAVLSSQSSLNVSGKNPPLTDVLSSKTDTNSLNQTSEKDPLIIDVPSHSTLLNKVTERTPKICKTMANATSPEIIKDPAVTVITLCCTDRKEGIAFHEFLQDPKQRMRWISAVRCQNTKPTHISVLCPKHFNEEQTNHPSALKENTEPNVFALDLLSQQKDVNCLQKWNEATPVNHEKLTSKDGVFELQHNPKEIDKFYMKVMYDESVSKIAKRLHSSQTKTITSDIDARKKLKRGKMCSPSDSSNLANIPVCSPQKAGKDLVNCADVGEKLKKSVLCSSADTNSNNPSKIKCLQHTPTEKLAKQVDASNNSQKDTIDTCSDPPDLPMHSPQTNGEETVNHMDGKEGLKKDVTCSSTENFTITRRVFSMRLPMKARKKLALYANKKLRKPLVYPPRNSEKEMLHSLKNSGVKRMGNKMNGGQNSLSISQNKEKIDPESSSSGNEITYCTTGTVMEGRYLIDSSTQTDLTETIDSNNLPNISTEMEERTNVVPKIVDVKGGIDPFNLLDITEMKNFIKVPNEWWGITCTPKYVICSKWNEGYDPVFKVVIEKDYNVKIFIKGRECVSENRKVSLENISALLQEVDSYEICAGVSDKSMTNCMGHLENESGKPFSIWCKGCQRKGKELMNKYKMLQELQ